MVPCGFGRGIVSSAGGRARCCYDVKDKVVKHDLYEQTVSAVRCMVRSARVLQHRARLEDAHWLKQQNIPRFCGVPSSKSEKLIDHCQFRTGLGATEEEHTDHMGSQWH